MARIEIELGQESDMPEGSVRQIHTGGLNLLLARVKDGIYAVDGECPHRGAQLSQGRLCGTAIVCPWHDWAFDVQTGEGLTNPHSKLQCYEIKRRNGTIFLITGQPDPLAAPD